MSADRVSSGTAAPDQVAPVRQVIDGGPAFPVHAESHNRGNGQLDGMTLRDYFAAKAMQGMLPMDTDNGRFRSDGDLARTTELAYRVADAMLKARSA